MATTIEPPVTLDEYFALERATEYPNEYYAGEIVPIGGSSLRHGLLQSELLGALGRGPSEERRMVCGLRVRLPAVDAYVYPDLCVVEGEPRVERHGETDTLLNPLLVVDILSPRTAHLDLGRRAEGFRKLQSLREYVRADTDRPFVEIYRRGEDGHWTGSAVTDPEGVVVFESVGVTVRLADLYAPVLEAPPAKEDEAEEAPRAEFLYVPLTPRQYLLRERAAEYRSEYHRGVLRAMTGAPEPHVLIAGNVHGSLWMQLRGRPCRVFQSEMKVKVEGATSFFYPDVVAVCGEPRYFDRVRDCLTNPSLLVEVLSPSTQRYDRTTKLRAYSRMESVRECLLVAQKEVRVELYRRDADGGWACTLFQRWDDLVPLESVGCTLAVADIYDRVLSAQERGEHPEPEPDAVTRLER